MTVHWSAPAWLWPLLLVVAAGAVIWTVGAYRATRPDPGPRLRRRLVALRAAAFVLLVVGIAAPVVSRLGRDVEPAEILVVVEDSASMAVTDAAGGRSRWQRAAEVVAAVDSLAATWGRDVRVTPLEGNGLEPLRPLTAAAPPSARGTDLNALADEALRRAAGRPVRALIVLSDGQETRSAGPPRRAGAGPAAFVVGLGDPDGPADRLIRDLRYPDTVHQGDDIVVDLLVDHRHARGGEAAALRVSLTSGGEVLADTLLGAVDGAVPVQLTVPARAEGLLAAEIAVSPLDNERFLANNTASLAVNVRRQRSRVLLIADSPGWDVRFLAQAAAAEPRLILTVVHPTEAGMVRADSLTPWTPPRDPEGWRDWDALVVTGWRPGGTGLDWPDLAEAVRGGRGLLVVPGAGPDRPGAPGTPPPALQALLPLRGEPWQWRPGEWRAGAAAAALRHPLLEEVGAGSGRWPPVRELVPVTVLPGAVTVLRARAAVAGADSSGQPLLIAGRAGNGRVVWYGGRRLWELAFAEVVRSRGADTGGEDAGRRMLRNMLAWLIAGDEDSGLVFVGRRTVHPEGEPIRLTAQWRDLRGLPVTGRAATVVVRRTGADSLQVPDRTQALRPIGAGVLEAALPPLPPGSYAATLRQAGDPPVDGATLPFVVAGHSVEDEQVRRDQRRLELLARALGGVALGAGDAGLPEVMAAALAELDWSPRSEPRRRRLDLWSSWPYLTLVTLLLAGEWFLRRRHGLL